MARLSIEAGARIYRHYLTRLEASQLLAFPLHQVLPLQYEILGDLVGNGELLNAKVVNNLGAELKESRHAEETHQYGQVAEELVPNEGEGVHVTHYLREGRLLDDRLLRSVRVKLNEAEKVQTQRSRQTTQ